MATNSTHSLIASSGGDYSSVQAWEDDIGVGLGTSTNLVTDDYDHFGYVAAEEFTVSGSAAIVGIAGHTTDTTHRIYLLADKSTRPGGAGTPTDASLFDDTSNPLVYTNGMNYAAFRNTNADSGNDMVVAADKHVVIEGISFKHSRRSIYGGAQQRGLTVRRCYFEYKNICISSPYENFFYFCVFRRNWDGGDFTPSANTSTISTATQYQSNIFNCTFIGYVGSDRSASANNVYALQKTSPAGTNLLVTKNCLFMGYENPIFWNAGHNPPEYCVSEYDSAILSGSNTNITGSDVNVNEIFFKIDGTDSRPNGLFAYDTSGTDLTANTGTVDLYGQTVTSTTVPIGAIKNIPSIPIIREVKYPNQYLGLLGSKKQIYGNYSTKDSAQIGSVIGKDITSTNINTYNFSSIWDLKDVNSSQEVNNWPDALKILSIEYITTATSTTGGVTSYTFSGINCSSVTSQDALIVLYQGEGSSGSATGNIITTITAAGVEMTSVVQSDGSVGTNPGIVGIHYIEGSEVAGNSSVTIVPSTSLATARGSIEVFRLVNGSSLSAFDTDSAQSVNASTISNVVDFSSPKSVLFSSGYFPNGQGHTFTAGITDEYNGVQTTIGSGDGGTNETPTTSSHTVTYTHGGTVNGQGEYLVTAVFKP